MKKQPRPSTVCIGLSIEGAVLRLATVGRLGQRLNVMDLATLPLPVKQYVAGMDEEKPQGSGANPFDEFIGGGDEKEARDGIDYSSIKEFINGHYVAGATLAVGMEEPTVRTGIFTPGEKDNSAKILARIIDETNKAINVKPSKKAIAFQRIGKKSVVAVTRIEENPLLDVFAVPHGSTKNPTRIGLVTSNEIALINLVRVHFRSDENQIVHVIHVGDDVTRFFVMRGNDIEYIAPPIQQGANDAHLVSTLYNRIELTAENAGFVTPDKVVLSGLAEDIGLKEEILENSPNVVFHSLKRLRISHSEDENLLRDMPEYTIPISLAWQRLQPKEQRFYRLDVTPDRISQEQKIFKLAWHGVILFALLFLSVMALTVLGLQRQAEIARLQSTLEFDRRQIEEQKVILNKISELDNRSVAIDNATRTLDTLLVSAELWSETLDTLARGTSNLGDIWVSELKPEKDGGYAVVGYAFKRASIPVFSNSIGKTVLREVTVSEIAETKVYRYDLHLAIDSLYPNSGSRASIWHDSISVALGPVAPSAKPEPAAAPAGPAK